MLALNWFSPLFLNRFRPAFPKHAQQHRHLWEGCGGWRMQPSWEGTSERGRRHLGKGSFGRRPHRLGEDNRPGLPSVAPVTVSRDWRGRERGKALPVRLGNAAPQRHLAASRHHFRVSGGDFRLLRAPLPLQRRPPEQTRR